MGIFDKLFGQKKDSTIQCDEREYMVWKWQSTDKASNKFATISKEAALLVNFGEVAVVIGNSSTGDTFTFIEGPYHDTLGNAYGGDASMVYFINTRGNNQVKFTVPFFDVADPRNVDLPVPVAVSGSIAITISDYRGFVNLNRLDSFNLTDFNSQIKDALLRHIKSVVANIPIQYEIPIVNLESQISHVNEIVQKELATRFMNDFGVTLKALDISTIRIDKESSAYLTLKSITQDISAQETKHRANLKLKVADAEVDVQIKEMRDEQAEKMRVRRAESNIELMEKYKNVENKHKSQKLQTEVSKEDDWSFPDDEFDDAYFDNLEKKMIDYEVAKIKAEVKKEKANNVVSSSDETTETKNKRIYKAIQQKLEEEMDRQGFSKITSVQLYDYGEDLLKNEEWRESFSTDLYGKIFGSITIFKIAWVTRDETTDDTTPIFHIFDIERIGERRINVVDTYNEKMYYTTINAKFKREYGRDFYYFYLPY